MTVIEFIQESGRGQQLQKVVYPNPTAAALTAPPVYGSAAHSNTYKMDKLLFSEQNLSPVGGPSTASVVNVFDFCVLTHFSFLLLVLFLFSLEFLQLFISSVCKFLTSDIQTGETVVS